MIKIMSLRMLRVKRNATLTHTFAKAIRLEPCLNLEMIAIPTGPAGNPPAMKGFVCRIFSARSTMRVLGARSGCHGG
jgi:hypothetical protein